MGGSAGLVGGFGFATLGLAVAATLTGLLSGLGVDFDTADLVPAGLVSVAGFISAEIGLATLAFLASPFLDDLLATAADAPLLALGSIRVGLGCFADGFSFDADLAFTAIGLACLPLEDPAPLAVDLLAALVPAFEPALEVLDLEATTLGEAFSLATLAPLFEEPGFFSGSLTLLSVLVVVFFFDAFHNSFVHVLPVSL